MKIESARTTRRSCSYLVFTIALGLAIGCSSRDGDLGEVSRVMFTPSTTGPDANGVRLTGIVLDDTTVQLHVVLDRSTETADVYAFAFDLELGSDGTHYVADSASLGTVLQSSNRALEVQQTGNRIVVGATILSDPAGSTVPVGSHTLMSMKVRSPQAGVYTTLLFKGSPNNPLQPGQNPAILNHVGDSLRIAFDAAAAVIER